MCALPEKTNLEKLEEVEAEIAHLIADALFCYLKRPEEKQEVRDVNDI